MAEVDRGGEEGYIPEFTSRNYQISAGPESLSLLIIPAIFVFFRPDVRIPDVMDMYLSLTMDIRLIKQEMRNKLVQGGESNPCRQ